MDRKAFLKNWLWLMFFYILAIFGFYKFTQFMGWEFTSFAGLFLIASGCLYFTIKMAKNAGAR